MPVSPLVRRRRSLLLLLARGRNAPFSPTDISGLKLWLKADSGAYTDAGTTLATNGQAVQQWQDQSGQNNHVSQATLAKRPTYVTGALNSLPVIRSDGEVNSQALASAAFGAALSQPTTIYVVGRRASGIVTGSEPFIDGIASGHRQDVYSKQTPHEWSIYASSAEISGGTVDANAHVFDAVFNGASSDLKVDGIATSSGNPGSDDLTGVTLFNDFTQGSGGAMPGDAAEFLIYSGAHTTPQRSQVRSYLGTRWGIVVS